jgi:hypothetical protein
MRRSDLMVKRFVLHLVLAAGALAYAAVCFHSVEEIHYLKSFFPRTFTVEEAMHAAAVELIKVVIIGMPILLIMGICALIVREPGSRKGP